MAMRTGVPQVRMPDQLPLKLDLARALLGEPAVETANLQAPSGAAAAQDLGAATAFIRAWEAWSPAEDVEWVERNWAAAGLGRQRMPVRVRVGSWDRVAALTGRTAELDLARVRFASLAALAPGSEALAQAAAKSHKSWMGLEDGDFDRLLAVIPWFVANPLSGLRSRAVPVEGVDTKWIERHRRLILRLLKPLGMDELGLASKRAMVRLSLIHI